MTENQNSFQHHEKKTYLVYVLPTIMEGYFQLQVQKEECRAHFANKQSNPYETESL